MNHFPDVTFAIVHSLQHGRHCQDAEDTLRWVEHNFCIINRAFASKPFTIDCEASSTNGCI
jgi:hypothetical protein